MDGTGYDYFELWATGPEVRQNSPACLPPNPSADLDDDDDVDHADFGIFQGCLSGEGVPADPACAD